MIIDGRRRTNDGKQIGNFPSSVFRHRSLLVQTSVYATVLVAFFLRAYRLADKNVWWDEGWSVWLSQKDLAWIALRTAMDEHPPLHYWLLHFWNMLAGTDAFAGRFVSLFFAVLTVALMYRIGKRVGGNWVGLLAALFLATARFHIWWSQDIKNYTPSIFFAFAAVWFGIEILNSGARSQKSESRNPIIGYAIFAALAMWTHYLAALVLLALNIYAVIVILSRVAAKNLANVNGETLRSAQGDKGHWLIANILAALLFAPWLYLYLQNAASWQAAPTFDFGVFLKLVATVLPLGATTNIDDYAVLTVMLTMIAILGCIPQKLGSGKQKAEDANRLLPTVHCLLFTLIVAFPPLLVYALSLTPVSFFAPKIQARYLLVLLPAYVMLLAFGVATLKRFSIWLAVAATVFVLGANIFVLNDYYAERRLTDEYTTLANTINSFARQGDVVFLHTDQEWPTFLYYLRAPLDWMGSSNGQPLNDRNADLLTTRATSRYNAAWLVTLPDSLATDPQKMIEMRLTRELPKRFDQTFGDKRLVLYASDARDLVNVVPENFSPQSARIEKISDTLSFLGFDLPVHEARVGDTLRVVTYWHATNPGAIEITVRGKSFAQSKGTRIETGERVRIETDFVIPPMSADELSISAENIGLARVRVEPRASVVAAGSISHPTDFRFENGIRLVGYDLSSSKFRAGENLPITLYWRTDQIIDTSFTAFVHIRGEQFNPKQNNPLWGQSDRVPSPSTTAWFPSEIIPDVYRVTIDSNASPGKYKIEIGMYDAATGKRLGVQGDDSIIIAEIQIQ